MLDLQSCNSLSLGNPELGPQCSQTQMSLLLVVRAVDFTEAAVTITNLKPLAKASKTDNSQGPCPTQTAGRMLLSLRAGKQQCT